MIGIFAYQKIADIVKKGAITRHTNIIIIQASTVATDSIVIVLNYC